MKEPKNDFEACVLALRLAITAPNDEKMQECLQIAESFNLSEFELERAKREAEKQIEENNK